VLVQSIDLAARLSASVLMGSGREVVDQWDTVGLGESGVVQRVASRFHPGCSEDVPSVLVIEDLPHKLPFASLVKAVCRLQGRIVQQMDAYGAADRVLFIPPALWQRHFQGVWRRGPAEYAALAREMGYEPPNLLEEREGELLALRGRERSQLRAKLKKAMTDYVDAYLIAVWAHETVERHGTLSVPSVQWYLPRPA
jgi:hypothetical protein